MKKLIEWVKSNKLATLLILIVLYFVFIRNSPNQPFLMKTVGTSYSEPSRDVLYEMGVPVTNMKPQMGGRMMVDSYQDSVNPISTDRKVVSENYLSLQVSDVPDTITKIKSMAESLGGFMVSSNVNRPEEAASGSITMRVPTEQSEKMISFLKDNSIKVVSEDMQGRDVTDQYTDIETRLATLQKNKARFEVIMDSAETVDEILRVQSQLFQLQDQIDSLIGQRDYLKNTSETVKITAYLATDEFALPYVPDTSWRPEVVFKEAVRSLIMDFRSLGNKLIWLAVYAVIWVPLGLIVIAAIKWWKTRSTKPVLKRK